MPRIDFNTFKEASSYSKSLATTLTITTAIHRDGNSWWVDDPRVEHSTAHNVTASIESPTKNEVLEDNYMNTERFSAYGHGTERHSANG